MLYFSLLPYPQVVRKNNADRVTVTTAGVTLHEAIMAADELAKQGSKMLGSYRPQID